MWVRCSLRGAVACSAARPARSLSTKARGQRVGVLGVPFEQGQSLFMDVPLIANLLQFSDVNWKYRTQPSDKACLGMTDRRCNFPRGKKKHGVSGGPGAIREAGLVDALRELGHDVQDFGDVTYDIVPDLVGPENLNKYQHVVACMREVSNSARRIQAEGRVCLSLGGDHSVAIGTLDATVNAHDDVAVIWVDAHADLNTPATSPSGSAHGMSMALLAKDLADYWPHLPGMDWQVPKLPLSNLAYIGLRSVDEYERLTLDKFKVCAFGMQEVQSLGIARTVELALRHVDPHKKRAIHLSFDIDALDSLEAPSTGTPVRGGLSLREGIHIMEKVHETGRLAAVDLVEVNPSLGSAADVRTTVQASLHLLTAAFGHCRLGNPPRLAELPLSKDAAKDG